MDGWMDGCMHACMDGWRRPNHMHSHLDALQTMPSVNFRRGAGEFHSVAKRASFNIALQGVLLGFRKGLRRFWEAKMEAKIDFFDVFSDVFF